MDYSETIKRMRDELLLTQAELAEMLNVSFATVNRWENGHCEPSMKAKRKLREIARKHKFEM